MPKNKRTLKTRKPAASTSTKRKSLLQARRKNDDEFILAIDENYEVDVQKSGVMEFGFRGVKITTNKQEIIILLDIFQDCCETFGTGIVLPPNVNSVSDLLSGDVRVYSVCVGTDWDWNSPVIKTMREDDEGGSITVNVNTSFGVIKLYAYRVSWNGYSTHNYKVLWNGYSDEGRL